MFKTLSAKLVTVLLGLLCLIGALYIAVGLFGTQMYVQEVNQKLNRSLAQHLVSEKILIEGDQVNRHAMEDLFHMLMVINPNIEIYLLNPEGVILACSAPPDKLQRKRIDLHPVREFLSTGDKMPVLGDDPRDIKRRKVFSAAVIPVNSTHQKIFPARIEPSQTAQDTSLPAMSPPVAGYLYVVLGGQAYDSAAQMLQGSYILRLSTVVIVVSVVLTLCAGLLLFKLLTRRLTWLTQAMDAFKQGNFSAPAALAGLAPPDAGNADEIDRLGATFKEMAARIQSQMQKLQQTDTLRRELVANVSHDLRTPLASLQGYLETLLLKEHTLSPEQQRSYLGVALRHSERLGKLVAELFELAKLDAQCVTLALEHFSLGELAQDVTQEFQLTAQKKGVALQTDIQKDVGFVCADIGLMQRVLENLIENALRYSAKDGRVTVSVARRQETVIVQVADTGCGIPADDLPHIFERFYRVEKARQGDTVGAGLGLAIVKRILDLHGVEISVHSVPQAGTTFTFHLLAQPL